MAVDTLGHLLFLSRRQTNKTAARWQAVQAVKPVLRQIAFVDQGYTGDNAANEAGEHGVSALVKLPSQLALCC